MADSGSRIALLGVPWDANSSFLRGPRKAPAAIRSALGSDAGNAWSENGTRVWPSDAVMDHGDIELGNNTADEADVRAIETAVKRAVGRTSRLICLGGDHAVSYPVVRALAGIHGPLDMLHIDAHPDLYPELQGNRLSHACPMARILEDGLVERLVQVGIRSHTPEQAAMAKRFGVRQFPPHDLPKADDLTFQRPVYISIDIDGLDPAFAPGVSHREPGGLTTREVLGLVGAVRPRNVVGADVVELNPDQDIDGMTATVAAKLVRELMALMLD